jgi:hypothetical protein
MFFRVAIITGELVHVSDLDQAVMIGYNWDIFQNFNSLKYNIRRARPSYFSLMDEHVRFKTWASGVSGSSPGNIPACLQLA